MRAMEQDREDDARRPEVEVLSARPTKSFLQFLAEQGQGAVANELSTRLRDLTEAIEMHFDQFRGKVKGELNVKIKFTLERGMYKVDVEYEQKNPKAPANTTMMWLGRDGNLATENPKQLNMPFSGITGGKAS